MKNISVLLSVVSLFVVSMRTMAQAQQFQHIVIIVQENRTPDELFYGAVPAGILGSNYDLQAPPVAKPKLVALGNAPDCAHTTVTFGAEASGKYSPPCLNSYVSSGADPYWQLAAEYGWANYMYQSNTGASYPAHEFLISGTSSTDNTGDWLVYDNAIKGSPGCTAAKATVVPIMNAADSKDTGTIYPCFTRASLLDLISEAGLTWSYYAPPGEGTWNAPQSLTTWYKKRSSSGTNFIDNPPQVLTDIANGNLADVVWVIPAGAYSDHPGYHQGGGPAWVASIVNAIGAGPYWQNTAILVTWDDWGGFWDHVGPEPSQAPGPWCVICGGFRVPLLVISAYTPQGYVDNDVHDFGSILHFVENNFGLSYIGPGNWADSYADDLSGFFDFVGRPRDFSRVKARKLTLRELKDRGAPDND
jgi:phospholipase C